MTIGVHGTDEAGCVLMMRLARLRVALAVLMLAVLLGVSGPWAAGPWMVRTVLAASALAADPSSPLSLPSPVSATPAQLDSLQEILARPEFQAAEGRSLLDRLLDPIRAWVRWLLAQVWELLARLFGPAMDAGGSAIVLGSVVVGLLIVLGTGIVLYRLSRGNISENAALAIASILRPPRATDELARAREAAGSGQFRQAIHHQYRAVLLRLDERDYLSLDRALTNRELLPRLTGAPELAGAFSELVSRFDRLWYGQTDCTAEEYAELAQLADRIWQGAERSGSGVGRSGQRAGAA
jgi:hypothetical protein